MQKYSDQYWMQKALEEAKSAFHEDEVPIGALLVKNDQIVARNHNRTRQLQDNLAHAEKLVIEEVIRRGEKFLYDYTLYVTIEPCVMCAGTIIWSRVGKVVFGAYDSKAGAVGSIYNVLLDKSFNHHPKLVSGICEVDCRAIVQDFFAQKREKK